MGKWHIKRRIVGPDAPELGTVTVISSTALDIPLSRAATGPTQISAYSLERSSGGGSATVIATGIDIFGAGGTYHDTGLTAATTYTYRCRAVDTTSRYSQYSAPVAAATTAAVGDTIAPTLPTNLQVAQVGATSLAVSWTASTDNVAVQDYDILRGDGDGAGNPVGSGAIIATTNATSYSDTGLTAGHEYYYRIRARDTSGNVSDYCARVFATTSGAVTGTILVGDSFEDRAIGYTYAYQTFVDLNLGGRGYGDNRTGTPYPPLPTVVTPPVGAPAWVAAKVVQYEVPASADTSQSYRSEHRYEDYGRGTALPANGTEFFEGCAIRLDPNWPLNDGCVIMQNHVRGADQNANHGRSPTSYGIRIAAGSYRVTSEALDTADSGLGTQLSATFFTDVAGDRGVWVRWVLHWRYSRVVNDGWMKIYRARNSDALELVYTSPAYCSANPYSQEMYYPKRGLYPGAGGVPANVVALYDAIRFSDSVAGGSVALVDPGNY